MIDPFRRPTKSALWLLAPLALFLWACVQLWPHTVDDAYIYVQYAKNQVEGNGLVFNVGDRVDAMSNYLWVLIMCLGGHLGFDILGWTKTVGVLLGAVQLVVAWWVARTGLDVLLGPPKEPPPPPKKKKKKDKGPPPAPVPDPAAVLAGREALAVLVPALMVIQPGTAYYAACGLGTPIFTLLALLGVGLHLADLARHGTPTSRWCYLPLAFAALSRPEAPLFLVVVAAHRGWLMLGPGKARAWPEGDAVQTSPLKPELLALGAAIALPVASTLGRIAYFGDFVNTYYCKPSTFFQNPTAAFGYFVDFAASHGPVLGTVLAVTAVWAFVRTPRWRVPGLFLGIAGAHGAFILYSGGDWMAQFRFFQPLLALAYVVPVLGIARRKESRILGIGLALLALLGARSVPQFIDDLEGNVVYDHAHRSQRNVEVGQWMGENLVAGEGLITDEIGALGLYSGLFIHDQWGIVDRELAHLFHDTGFNPYNTSPDLPLRTESLARIADILVDREPRYAMLDYMGPPPSPDHAFDPRFLNPYTMRELWERMRSEYTLIASFPVMEDSDIAGRGKTFLLFERRDAGWSP